MPMSTPSKTSVTSYPAGFCIPRSDNLTVTTDGTPPAELNATKAQLPFGSIGRVHSWICPNWNKQQLHRIINIEYNKTARLNHPFDYYTVMESSRGHVQCKSTRNHTRSDPPTLINVICWRLLHFKPPVGFVMDWQCETLLGLNMWSMFTHWNPTMSHTVNSRQNWLLV